MDFRVAEVEKRLGLDLKNADAYYLLEDTDKYFSYVSDTLKKAGIIVMGLKEALQRYPWAKRYLWKALKRKDEWTRSVDDTLGYFIYAKKGARSPFPVQTCLYITKEGITQPVHNIIVAEEGAVLDVVTGCTALTDEAFHIGVSEFYVGENAMIRYIMIHNWERNVEARPRTGAIVGRSGKFISYYANFFPARLVQSKPVVRIQENGYAYLSSILYAKEGTVFDIGAEAHLEGRNARAEVVSRAVVDGGKVISPLEIHADADETSGHIDCKALQLHDGFFETVPRLVSHHPNVELSHEAFVGRLDRKKLEYLMSKGLTEEEATSLLIRGFLRLEVPFVTEAMRIQFDQVAKLVAERATG